MHHLHVTVPSFQRRLNFGACGGATALMFALTACGPAPGGGGSGSGGTGGGPETGTAGTAATGTAGDSGPDSATTGFDLGGQDTDGGVPEPTCPMSPGVGKPLYADVKIDRVSDGQSLMEDTNGMVQAWPCTVTNISYGYNGANLETTLQADCVLEDGMPPEAVEMVASHWGHVELALAQGDPFELRLLFKPFASEVGSPWFQVALVTVPPAPPAVLWTYSESEDSVFGGDPVIPLVQDATQEFLQVEYSDPDGKPCEKESAGPSGEGCGETFRWYHALRFSMGAMSADVTHGNFVEWMGEDGFQYRATTIDAEDFGGCGDPLENPSGRRWAFQRVQ